MNAIQKMGSWGETHHPAWLDVFRIVLGIILVIKGISFLRDTGELSRVINDGFKGWSAFALVHYVAFAHVFGGFLIAIGLLTRLMALIQLPIIIGAIIFINSSVGVFSIYSQMALAIITLILLVVFIIVGSGPYSLDHYYKTHKPAK